MKNPNVDRRQFVAGAALASLGLAANVARADRSASKPSSEPDPARAGAPGSGAKMLVLGGTRFLGPAVVEAALARGMEVTLFNRGRSDPDRFTQLETLLGDRDPNKGEGLKALEGDRTWDYVVDTSSYFPRITRASVGLLKDRVKHYTMVSTVSVYGDMESGDIDESTPVARIDDPTTESMGDQFQNYGPLKALCEEAAEELMPGRVFNVRPGLIVGPDDASHRFTYWPVRVREGGEVLVGGNLDDSVQYIDVRDLGEYIVHAAVEGLVGVYNAVGPSYGQTIAGLVYGCRAVVESDARFTWVPTDGVSELGLAPWGDLPVWSAGSAMDRVHGEKAWKSGLHTRDLADTVRATLESWDAMPDAMKQRPAGMTREREKEALAAWHAR
ncbi:MAG: NAD-dependent epimerase/dehydratase family protein [Planctomycetota bacterium]